jgi:peptide/nickel transport system permease protein
MESSVWTRLKRDRAAVAGLAIVLLLAAAAILAPAIARHDPISSMNLKDILSPPSVDHPLGTDQLGRDVLSRMLYGTRISLAVGFLSAGIATFIGIMLGGIAGFYGGAADSLIMRLVDIMLCFPTFFLILAVIAFLEPSIINVMVVIGLTSWMGVTRLVRAEFLTLRERDFVTSARAQGIGSASIIFRHILPNAVAPALVSMTLGIAGAILTESALSFLGLGVQPPTPSWGNMLTAGKDNIEIAWWLSVFPGMAILITVLGYNFLGEGIRDAFDPRLKAG